MALTLTPRSAGLMVALALGAGWMGASLVQNQTPAQSSRESGIPRPLGTPANAVPRAETLRQRMIEPPLPNPGRNPFVYGSRAPMRPTSYRDREVAPMAAPPVAVELPPQLPIFKLSGIASSADAGATVLTAIIIDNGSMVFAKAGDKLSNGYSVVSVGETSVTLSDSAGVTQTVRLP
jgi:hypothetical protein